MGNKVKIHLQMDFNKIEIIKNDFYEIAGILSIHNNFLDTVNTVHDLIKTYEAYESNPYLYPLLQNTFYNYNLDRELRLMDFDQQLFNKDINQNKDQNERQAGSLSVERFSFSFLLPWKAWPGLRISTLCTASCGIYTKTITVVMTGPFLRKMITSL